MSEDSATNKPLQTAAVLVAAPAVVGANYAALALAAFGAVDGLGLLVVVVAGVGTLYALLVGIPAALRPAMGVLVSACLALLFPVARAVATGDLVKVVLLIATGIGLVGIVGFTILGIVGPPQADADRAVRDVLRQTADAAKQKDEREA
jgi:hypothetical protein